MSPISVLNARTTDTLIKFITTTTTINFHCSGVESKRNRRAHHSKNTEKEKQMLKNSAEELSFK